MLPFGFATANRIRFGRGQARAAVPEIAKLGQRIGLIHGEDAQRSKWLHDDLLAEGCTVIPVTCAGEPGITLIEAAVRTLRAAEVNTIVAIGGGAVIDAGKALAALIPSRGSVLDHLEVVGEGLPLEVDPLPFAAIPTTAGTGAEVTRNAVIRVSAHRRKVSLRDDRMLARLAVIDPALTDNTPLPITLACGLDALTQVIEPYVCSRPNPLTDALCRDAIPRGLRALSRLIEGEEPSARDDMAVVSLIGGIALANAGLGAVHGFAGVIGGRYPAPHGAICGALLPHVLMANLAAAKRGPGRDRLSEVVTLFFTITGGSPLAFVDRCHKAGLPRLNSFGLLPDQTEDIATHALASSSMMANPVDPRTMPLADILRNALK